MNYTEILEVLKSKLNSVEEFAFEDYKHEDLGLGEIKEIEQYGGEGQGDTWYSIKHFVDHNIFIKVSGFYSSYNGTDFYDGWNECSEVKPQQKTVTVYETV